MLFNIENYNLIRNKLKKSNENKEKTSIIAISKEKNIDFINDALKNGVNIFGENRVQEAYNKFLPTKLINKDIELHMVGPLQTNKVKKALKIFDYFHTLDRESLALEFNKDSNRQATDKKFFFIQVNTGMELQKSGISQKEADEFITFCIHDLKINIIGLMCIPPLNDIPSKHFKILRNISLKHDLKHLSMGMSDDYEIAIQEGATYIRIGTMLFGKR